jgi:hypothetical protein
MQIDHVVYGVTDLQRAARRFEDDFGLRATDGGEHPDFGTRNRIVSVGHGQFIELMAVADATSEHPLAAALSAWLQRGDRLVALCLRPDDLDATAARLSTPVIPAERHNPDGDVLHWRLAGVEAALGPERLPFFIDWQGAEEWLDAQHQEAASTEGIAWVEYGGDAERLHEWTGDVDLPVRVVDTEPGPRAIGLRRGAATVVIR